MARAGSPEWTLYPVAASCALHAAEEYLAGWQEWAATRWGLSCRPLVILALLFARSGWRRPVLSLLIPSATLVNAVFFHMLPTIVQGRVSSGVYTAALLYVPFRRGRWWARRATVYRERRLRLRWSPIPR